jgi:hypothetical protein
MLVVVHIQDYSFPGVPSFFDGGDEVSPEQRPWASQVLLLHDEVPSLLLVRRAGVNSSALAWVVDRDEPCRVAV